MAVLISQVIQPTPTRIPILLSPEAISASAKALIESGDYRSEFPGLESKEIRVLAWYREKDRRPVFMDCALVWVRFEFSKGQRWVLIQMARNPIAPSGRLDQMWHEDFVFDGPNGVSIFDHPPTLKDLRSSVRNFQFNPTPGFTRYDSFIDSAAWRVCFGQAPPAL